MSDQLTLKEQVQKRKKLAQVYEKEIKNFSHHQHEKTKSIFAIAVGIIYTVYVIYMGATIYLNASPDKIVEVAEQFGVSQIIPIVTLVFGYYFGQNKE